MPRSATSILPPPLTPGEMRELYAAGDTVQSIFARAYRRDRTVTIGDVREILFGARY